MALLSLQSPGFEKKKKRYLLFSIVIDFNCWVGNINSTKTRRYEGSSTGTLVKVDVLKVYVMTTNGCHWIRRGALYIFLGLKD